MSDQRVPETPEDKAIKGRPVLTAHEGPGPVLGDRRPPEGEGYDLEKVYAEKAKPFWFRWAGQWWELPHLKMLDFEVQARVSEFDFGELAEASGEQAIEAARAKLNELFTLLMGPEQGAEWAKVPRPLEPMLDMIQQWSKHSGADQGESSASASSSRSTGRPSKRTSTASTGSGSRRRSTGKKATPPGSS